MPTGNEAYTTYERGWIVRIQPPMMREPNQPAQVKEPGKTEETAPLRSLLILHGWTGDEKVMWVFTRNLPGNYWIFAPRGPVPAPEGGYGWLPHTEDDQWPPLTDFAGIAEALMLAFRRWAKDIGAPNASFDVMGFSQGAAMAYALAAFFPREVNRVIALAGFLPPDEPFMPGRYRALDGKKIYIAHGTRDETIPVTAAQETVRSLQSVGAQVTYCESDVGHKLSASCLRGLETFLK